MSDLSEHPSTPTALELAGTERVVVVAIAGPSVAAVEQLAGELPSGRGMAFIVVVASKAPAQRWDVKGMQRATSLRVVEVRGEVRPAADHVYLASQGQLVTYREDGFLVATSRADELPLDRLFRSLANHHAERSAAILLSGIRGDGSIGAAELKAAGGLVIVQAPTTSTEAGSPEQQLFAKGADLVLPLPRLLSPLLDYFVPASEKYANDSSKPFGPETLMPMMSVLSAATGHDFGRYKRSTVSRRVQRRMRVHGVDAGSYAELLSSSPAEAELLFNELLIGVTSFFRDPNTFQALEKALDQYLERLPANQDLRIWVPACSTGEEAYSIAMLLHECVHRANKNQVVKLFATDVDPKAIEFARAGRYPIGISAYVSRERLERFFVREDDGYRINKETRERIVFAPHNVTRDPPFTHIDLISCRNLLIYLEAELQREVLGVFEYALGPGGLLLLGGSESVGGLQSCFDPIDKQAKLYVHRTAQPRRPLSFPIDPLWTERSSRRDARLVARVGTRNGSSSPVEQLLISEFAPPSAIITPNGELAFIHGRTGSFLEPAVGEPSTNIFDMAREGLRLELPAAVRAAHHSRQEVVRRHLAVRTNGSVEPVRLTVKPLDEPASLRGLLLVTFAIEERAAEGHPAPRTDETSNLETELQYVQSTLQSMVEDLEASNEELKSMNEELQSTNEEVQSSNEELSTSREELQSLNEELQTLNEELAHRNSLLSQSNDDMYNLLSAVHVATVFVDAQLNVKRFTAPAKKVFRLRESDIGRPVSDLVVNLDYQTLAEDAQEVLRSLVFAEREVLTPEGEWRLMRILPYRTANNVIDGLIITVTDIQRFKQTQKQMTEVQQLFDDILATLPAPVVLLDESFKLLAVSVEFARRFGTTEPDLVGKSLSDLGVGWRHAAVKERLQSLQRGEPCVLFRLQGNLGTPFPVDVLVQPRRLRGVHSTARYVFLFQEVTKELPPAIAVD